MAACLIIDDVTVTRFAARTYLEELGLAVFEAEDVKKALTKMSSKKVDVILLDWHLKKDSGLELLKTLREKYGRGVKVIMFSGVEDGDRTAEAMAAGADGYLSKPTSKDKIEAEFRKVGIL